MPVTRPIHHAVCVGIVGLGDREGRIRKDRCRNAFVGHLLFDRIQWVGGDTHDLVDAKRLKLADIRLDVLDLIPARLAGQSFLEEQEDSLSTQRGKIEGAAIGRLKLNKRGLFTWAWVAYHEMVLTCRIRAGWRSNSCIEDGDHC